MQTCLALDPNYFRAMHDLGYAAYLKKEFTIAEEKFRSALKLQPYDVRCLKQLANSLLAQAKVDEARACLEKCQRINPQDSSITDALHRIDTPLR